MKFTLNKKLVLLLIAGLSFATTQAQIGFGVKAGANFSSITGSDAQGFSSLIGFNGGVLVRIHLNDRWSIQPEALYSGQGAKFSDSTGSANLHNAYLNIPIMLCYSLPLGLSFQAGPQFGLLLSANESAQGVSVDIKQFYNTSDVSIAMGASFMTPFKLGFDARYNLGLANIEKTSLTTGTGTLKNGVFQVGVFYMLAGK
jgi:Outer membrane protein beta-barrel domain